MTTFHAPRLLPRALASLLGAVLAVAATLVAAPPAHAAPSATLLIKSQGSLYTDNFIVNQGIVPGVSTARSFGLRILNTGTQAEQYRIVATPQNPHTTAVFMQGTKVLGASYYTTPIAPGATWTFTLKVTLGPGATQNVENPIYIDVRDPGTGDELDTVVADAHATHQVGSSRNDIFLKTGTQPYVGGSASYQYETGNALKPGGSTTFNLRLQNNGVTATPITLYGTQEHWCSGDNYEAVVKVGTKDVTALVFGAGYVTPSLAPDAKKSLKVIIERTTSTVCPEYFDFTSSGPDAPVTVYAHVVPAYLP